jgi:adenine-specific DNA-methyltransferase
MVSYDAADLPATARIRYMGNKHAIAGEIAGLVSERTRGIPIVDVFCGLSSIASAIAPSKRPVWGNDVQAYAALAARCQTASAKGPLKSGDMARRLAPHYSRNLRALKARFEDELATEARALRGPGKKGYRAAHDTWTHAGNDPRVAAEVDSLRAAPDQFPARLCVLSYSWGYFGLKQSMSLDSIRFALDQAHREHELSRPQWEWGVLAMLQAASICAATSGHFAQYLRGRTETSYRRILRQRARDPWVEFLTACDELQPFGSREWRRLNRCYSTDALGLWPKLDTDGLADAIIYADPPYSRDQYSRFYHVLETLVRYDYPSVSGIGRYRADRFQTEFSVKSKVRTAFERLLAAISDRDFSLVLSYPSNGLFMKASPDYSLEEVLRDHFDRVELAMRARLSHSTLGARHGASSVPVEELVWIAD